MRAGCLRSRQIRHSCRGQLRAGPPYQAGPVSSPPLIQLASFRQFSCFTMWWRLISPRLGDVREEAPPASKFDAMPHPSTRNLTVGSSYRCTSRGRCSPVLSQTARQQGRDSEPSRSFLGIRRDRTRCACFACLASQRTTPAKTQAKNLDPAFKVRPVESSTARHDALDADAMLHHHAG